MTDPKPGDLVLIPDDDVAFALRLGGYRDNRGRMKRFPGTKTNYESDLAHNAESERVIKALRSQGVLFCKRWPSIDNGPGFHSFTKKPSESR